VTLGSVLLFALSYYINNLTFPVTSIRVVKRCVYTVTFFRVLEYQTVK
jgi:hypothetical protein